MFFYRLKWLRARTKVNLSVEYLKYNNKKVILEFALFPEAFSNKIGGDIQLSPDPLKLNIIAQSDTELTFMSPKQKGAYRVFAYVRNEKGQCSVANIPFMVE